MSSADTAWIAIRQWHSYARRLERRHLRQEGVSWSATTIARRASAYIVEIQPERIRAGTSDTVSADDPNTTVALTTAAPGSPALAPLCRRRVSGGQFRIRPTQPFPSERRSQCI